MRAWRARGGYIGCTRWMRRPWETPWETRTRCGVATLGTATGVELMMPPMTPPICPPGTPPGTPPTTPAEAITGGGASSSLIISTFLGILVGVRNSPLMMSVCTTLTTRWGTAAGGGGGGGGGGGATRNVINCCLGRASVQSSGIRMRMPTRATCRTNEIVVVIPRFVLSLPPDSMRLSLNIRVSPDTGPYTFLDTKHWRIAPKTDV